LTFAGVERMESGQKGIEGFLGRQIKREREVEEGDIPLGRGDSKVEVKGEEKKVEEVKDEKQWVCPSCDFAIPLEVDGLEGMKQEHEDYHYALKLSEGIDVPPRVKKRKKDTGIRAFFSPKT
jgi:DNA polymerase eta